MAQDHHTTTLSSTPLRGSTWNPVDPLWVPGLVIIQKLGASKPPVFLRFHGILCIILLPKPPNFLGFPRHASTWTGPALEPNRAWFGPALVPALLGDGTGGFWVVEDAPPKVFLFQLPGWREGTVTISSSGKGIMIKKDNQKRII